VKLMDDNEADQYYSDPENLRPLGPARRRSGGVPLTSHVPVRFSPALVAAVKALADRDGTTVSTWIRNVVTQEVQRRTPPRTIVQHDRLIVTWDTPPHAETATQGTRPKGVELEPA
jgi:hypothetical protein